MHGQPQAQNETHISTTGCDAVCLCRMLERWLCEGIVHDPYEEFMIQEHKVIFHHIDKAEA